MAQQNRMEYQQDLRTEAQVEADNKAWVKAHTTDYRQRQAQDTVPPEDPNGGHGGNHHSNSDPGDGSNGQNKQLEKALVWICICGAAALAIVGAWLKGYFSI